MSNRPILKQETVTSAYGVVFPSAEVVIATDNPREVFVAKLRELADRVESGELRGASCYWNNDQPAMVYVENSTPIDGRGTVRLIRATFELPAGLHLVKEG